MSLLFRYVKPELLRLLGGSVLLAALTELVLRADAFSHDDRFLSLLRGDAVRLWCFALFYAGLLALRRHLDPEGTARVLADPLRFGAAAVAILIGLASPFMNAYFTHVTHPLLAVCLSWSVFPLLDRWVGPALQRARERAVAGVGGHAALIEVLTPWGIAACAATVVFVQSYRRHIWFGSGGKDLGLFHQSVWLLSRFESPHNTIMGMNAFADHMEWVDIAAAPLQWLWPTAGALLLFQALLVGLGLLPIFWLAFERLGSPVAGLALAAVYVFGIDAQHAVMFDWNPTTCGAALMPWIAWSHERERPLAFGASVVAAALCKENLVLYVLGLCLALAVGSSTGRRRAHALIAAAGMMLLFVIEIKLLFPIFRDEGFRHLRFGHLGQSAVEMIGNVLVSPYEAFALLFTPGRKIDGLLSPLSTVAFICLLAPRYALAIAPVVLERFWSTHTNRWWGHHYGAGAGVVATLAAIEGLARLRRSSLATRRWVMPVALLSVVTSCLLVSNVGRFGRGPLWVWRQPYFASAVDRADATRVLAVIPAEAEVAAQNHLLPHLSARRQIYEITPPVRAEWVALDFAQSAWPYDTGYAKRLASELVARGYGLVACSGQAIVLRQGADGSGVPCSVRLAPR